ncbi:flagellar hook-length control protein FliK [Anaeromusa acidaminophila]|uniref:flagellar hook-length control protein FliK n=1 Tax=Anaeromusa acidaminophila TaxID=81464 RepID=UPI0003A6E2C9|nr:flagellar hook-length control protein FliK [Anaeromusa acidaminophila]
MNSLHGLQQVVGKREISMEIRNLQGLMQHWLPQVKGNTEATPPKAAAALQGSGVKVGADGVDMQADGEMKAALQRLQGVMQEQLKDVSELPAEVRKVVEAILEQYTQAQKVVPEGINAMLTSPRQAADLLSRLAEALSEGATLKEEGGEAVKQLVDRLVSAFKDTLPASPGDLAAKLASLVQDINGRQGPLDKELTQLLQQLTAKMLRGNGTAGNAPEIGAPITSAAAATDALKQMAQSNEALLAVMKALTQEEGIGAALQEAGKNSPMALANGMDAAMANGTAGRTVSRSGVGEGPRAVLQQLVQAFQSQLPEELQSPGMQGQVLEGTRLWALLKTVESGATAGLNRQEFKASGETFRQLAAWLNGGAQGETPDLGELFGLVQFLPESSQQSIWSLARQQGLPEVLRQWAASLGDGGGNQTDVPKELSSLQQRMGNSSDAVRMANLLNEAADWLEGNSNRSLAAMGRMVKLLPPEVARLVQQVLAQDGAAEQLRNMGNLFTQLSEEAPQSQTLLFLRQAGAQAPAGGADGAAQTAQRLLALISQLASRQGQAEGELTQILQQWQAKVQGDPAQTLLLERAVRQFGAQVPPDVAQTALKSNMPDLPRFWVLLKTMEAGEWNELPVQVQRKSAEVVRELASSLQRPAVWEADVKTEHSLLTFTNTLLFNPQGTPYPMYWHVYHQQKQDAQGRDTGEFETWLRVCLETENMGTVDVVFRYYDEKALDVRLRFEGEDSAEAFREVLPEVRQAVGELPFELGDIWVSRGGKKENKGAETT